MGRRADGDTIDAHPGSILVAHSLGGALVANAARQYPEINVTAAMLVSPSDVDWVEHIEAVGPVPLQDDRRRQSRRSPCQVRAGGVFCR
jgi:predicted alpha/beta hydrolase family esterase